MFLDPSSPEENEEDPSSGTQVSQANIHEINAVCILKSILCRYLISKGLISQNPKLGVFTIKKLLENLMQLDCFLNQEHALVHLCLHAIT